MTTLNPKLNQPDIQYTVTSNGSHIASFTSEAAANARALAVQRSVPCAVISVWLFTRIATVKATTTYTI